MNSQNYTIDELMVCVMAREMRDGELVVQGISTPLVFTAFILAKKTHAPNLYFMYLVGNSLADMPGQVSISFIEIFNTNRFSKSNNNCLIFLSEHFINKKEHFDVCLYF